MNKRMVLHIIGQIVALEAALLALPLIISLIYGDGDAVCFLVTVAVALAAGGALIFFSRPKSRRIYAREGFVTVAGAWILLSAIGALPFVISGQIPSYIDAFFETVSGFTTTGASILRDVGALTHGIAFWRSFTHWSGGMGVLVLVMAIAPGADGNFIHVMRAEVPGPSVGKLVPRVRETAKILYLIYIAMTALEILLLLAGGMPLFDSVVHAFGTAGTGGFGIRPDSIAGYNAYLQWVITAFMMLFGVNFNLYYFLLTKRAGTALKSRELWVYFGIFFVSAGVITASIFPTYGSLGEAARAASFQTASIMSTTGFTTADYSLWSGTAKSILLLLMFIGACAGSTAGGIKVSRVILLFKNIRAELRKMLHPRSVTTVRFEGKSVSERMLDGVKVYLAVYILIFLIGFFILSLDRFDFETNFSAVASCFNNIGPAFGAAGPAHNYADFSVLSKLTLSACMLLGRLEIYPLLLALTPATWTRK